MIKNTIDSEPASVDILNVFKSTIPRLETLIVLAGVAQFVMALSSLAIPHLLGWRKELMAVSPLTRSVFWTYAGYTFGIHLCFAAISIGAPRELASGGVLATAVCGFIALYWGIRVLAQFAWYDRSLVGGRLLFRLAEIGYVALFSALTVVNSAAALRTLWR